MYIENNVSLTTLSLFCIFIENSNNLCIFWATKWYF